MCNQAVSVELSYREIDVPGIIQVLNFTIFLVSARRRSRLLELTTKCLDEGGLARGLRSLISMP